MSRAEAGSTQKAIPASAGIITKELIARINEIRPGLITGCYLTGSIAQNDFHPDKSDIDFVMLCNSFPDAGLQQQIRQIHKSIRKDFKWPDLNGCYITADSLNVHRARATQTLSFQEGQLTVSAFDMAPITLYELKTAAITIHGLPAENLPIVIEEKDVHDFLLGNINSYWTAWVRKYASIRQCKFLLILIPRLTEWGPLGVARQLYTLKTGQITSKTAAGYYCLEQLPAAYHSIMRQAIDIRNDDRRHLLSLRPSYYVQPSVRRAADTIACVRYIIRLFNEEYHKLYGTVNG